MERLNGAAVRLWAQAAASALETARGSIDSLNVFPVADADTGTNLYLTVAQGADEVAALGPHVATGEALRAFARGALLGARGNSGAIASQFLLGLARGFAGGAAGGEGPGGTALEDPAHDDGAHAGPLDDLADGGPGRGAVALARALDEAQRAARGAVARPVEGTILTAATAAAAAARVTADAGGDLGATAVAALAGAREALARTPDELAVLRAAGVVDAGATGLVVILEALVGVVTGRPAPGVVPIEARAVPRSGAGGAAATGGTGADGPHPEGEFEVMFLVESDAGDLAPELSTRLQALGESVAVVGGPGVWHAHVHTDDPAAAVAAGALGTQRQITVRHLRQQIGGRPVESPAPGPPAATRLGLVVGTRAPALIRELARSGAVVMVLTGAPASTASVLRAVVDTGAAHVAVLPGSPDARVAALAAADGLASGRVPTAGAGRPAVLLHVIEAVDDVHVVAGLAAAMTGRSAPAATIGAAPPADAGGVAPVLAAIRRAVAAVRTADVEVSDAAVARRVADDLLAAGGDVLTMLRGAGAGDAVMRSLLEHLSRVYPALEVVVLDGGQVTPAVALAVE